MAWSPSVLGAGLRDNVDRSSYTYTFDVPSAGLIVAIIGARGSFTGDPAVSDSTALTWSKVAAHTSGRYLGMYVAKATGSVSSMVLTADFSAVSAPTAGDMDLIFFPSDQADVSGTAIQAIGASGTANSGAATSLNVTLSATPAGANAIVSTAYYAANEAATPATDFTELTDAGHTAPVSGMATQWRTGHTSTTVTSEAWSTSSGSASVAAEIIAAAGGGPGGTSAVLLGGL